MKPNLTPSQMRALSRMGACDHERIVHYGTACGVKRASARKLDELGFAIYMPNERGVACRITKAGRSFLQTV